MKGDHTTSHAEVQKLATRVARSPRRRTSRGGEGWCSEGVRSRGLHAAATLLERESTPSPCWFLRRSGRALRPALSLLSISVERLTIRLGAPLWTCFDRLSLCNCRYSKSRLIEVSQFKILWLPSHLRTHILHLESTSSSIGRIRQTSVC